MPTKFIHCRQINQEGKITPNGGMTIAYTLNNEFKVVGFAVAKCHMKDHYNKKVGRMKAKGRLKSPNYYIEVNPPMAEQEFIEGAFNGYKTNING